MRKTTKELADILFHAYELGDIDNIFYWGKWNNMSDTIKQELDQIELEDLAIVKEYSYGVILNRIREKIDQEFINSMFDHFDEKEFFPELQSIHFMIAEKYFTVLKDGKKISPSLYATPQKLSTYLEPLKDKLIAAAKGDKWDDSMSEARFFAHTIGYCNPFFYALKSSPEFVNTDLRTLILVVIQYLKEKYGIDQELLEKSYSFNNIKNWRDLFPRTKRDLDPLIKFARKRITAQRFRATPSNKQLTDFVAAIATPSNGQMNFLNRLEISISNNLTLTYDDVKDITTLKTTEGTMFFIMLLQEYIAHPNPNGDVQLSIDKIQELRGYSNKTAAWTATRKADKEISRLGFEIKDKNRSSGYFGMNANVHFIKNGVYYFRFQREFIDWITGKGSYIADIPKHLLGINVRTNPNSFYLGYYIAIDHRRNEGNPRKISVRSLINCCPDLKEKFEKGDRLKEYVMSPLIRDLDNISGETFFFDWYDPTGNRIDNIWDIKTGVFFNCFIQVDYSDFPKHEERLEHAEKRKKQEQAALDRARANRIVKKEDQENT